jgi:hypothetical protein
MRLTAERRLGPPATKRGRRRMPPPAPAGPGARDARVRAGRGLSGALTAQTEPIAILTIEIRPVDAGGDRMPRSSGRSARAGSRSPVPAPSEPVSLPLPASGSISPPALGRGAATTAALEARGHRCRLHAERGRRCGPRRGAAIRRGDTVFLPRTDIADWRLVGALELRGARVDAVVAYRTVEGPETSRERLRSLFAAGGPEVIVFTSASTVRGLIALLGRAHLELARRAVACCIGEPTATAARNAGFDLVLVAAAANGAALARLVRTALAAPAGSPATDPAPARRATDPAPTRRAPERRQEDPA